MVDFFLFRFLGKGHFTYKSIKIGIIEGAIASILRHKANFDLEQNIDHLFLHEICTVQRVNALVHPVKVSNQGAV